MFDALSRLLGGKAGVVLLLVFLMSIFAVEVALFAKVIQIERSQNNIEENSQRIKRKARIILEHELRENPDSVAQRTLDSLLMEEIPSRRP